MPSRELGLALGKLFRNLKSPKWLAAEAGSAGMSVFVIAPLGHKVKAYLQHRLHHEHGHVADLHEDGEGNEYLVADGKNYRYDPDTDTWFAA